MTTGIPCAARAKATALPMPREAPVTKAYLICVYYNLESKSKNKKLIIPNNSSKIKPRHGAPHHGIPHLFFVT
jgi:hypothetical protein